MHHESRLVFGKPYNNRDRLLPIVGEGTGEFISLKAKDKKTKNYGRGFINENANNLRTKKKK